MFEYSFWSLGHALQDYGVILPQGAYKAPKKGKMCPKIANGNVGSDSCGGDPKLRNEYSNIKIRQELTSEMRKMWGNLKFLHDHEISQLFHNQIT